jgi:CrcB protein
VADVEREERHVTGRVAAPASPRRDPRLLAAIFFGGALGAGARAAVAHAFPDAAGGWPWATFALNVGGSALLAFFATRLQERLPPSLYKRPLLGTGICGALTTFSTLQLEVVKLGRDGHALLAFAYVSASVGAGLAMLFGVSWLTRRASYMR